MNHDLTVERLHYFNGRRLEAADLELEQRYHLDMRRRLNRELFTPGVVSGLEVAQALADDGKPSKTKVRVADGLALDPLGRELVVAEQALAVPAQPPTKGRDGYFLVVRYREERLPADEDPCHPPGPTYARIREEPELMWTEEAPAHVNCRPGVPSRDCAVMLAFVRVSGACEIVEIVIGVRAYAHPVHTGQVAAFALEGEKDIDKDNPKTLHFVIRGGLPDSVLLYLWGEKFSSLYYTELGAHKHSFDATKTTGPATTSLAEHTHSVAAHSHLVPDGYTSDATPHHHLLRQNRNDVSGYLPPVPPLTKGRVVAFHSPGGTNDQYHDGENDPDGNYRSYVSDESDHGHTVTFKDANGNPITTGSSGGGSTGVATPTSGTGSESHTHASLPDTASTGLGSSAARSSNENAHTYLANLRVELDGADVTPEILKQLGWTQLGDGVGTFATDSIDLLASAAATGVPIDEDDHTLVFKVASGGGQVLYNLYVE